MADRRRHRVRATSGARRSAGQAKVALIVLALALACIPLGYLGHHLWPHLHPTANPSNAGGSAGPSTPTRPPSSRVARLVDDEAAVLDESQTRQLTQIHAILLSKYDIDLRVVTVEGAEPLDREAQLRYAALRVGALSQRSLGVLLLVDALTRLARLKVASALRAIFTEPFCTYVEAELMLPYFQDDRLASGILAASAQLAQRARNAAAKRPFVRPGAQSDSMLPLPGGGTTDQAEAQARAASRPPGDLRPASQITASRKSPLTTFRRYLRALASGDGRPQLPIYTAESQQLLEQHTPTRSQIAAVVETYRLCPAPRVKKQKHFVVLRFPKRKRRCAPYFLRRESGAWRLDLATMARSIRYNRRGQWHLARGVDHPYRFAFRDWRFDYYGFPR